MTKPVIVLLHGVGLDHTLWEPVVALLEPHADVRTPDLPGHGGRAPVPPGTTLDDLVDGVLDDVPAGAHLVGFSLGALVAQALALRAPGRIAGLVSVSSVCRRTPEERASVLDRLRTAADDLPRSFAASLDRWYTGTAVSPEWVERTSAVLHGNDPGSFLACYRVFATADADLAAELHRIAVPALAVTGADDPGSTPAMTRRLAEAIPGCRAEVLPGSRHMLPVERPDALAAHLLTFVREAVHG